MKKVLLISFFKSTNLGDRAIGEQAVKCLSEMGIVEKMDITGKPFVENSQTGGVSTQKSKLYNVKCVYDLLRKDRFSYAYNLIAQNDAIVFFGGNMIMDTTAIPLYSYLCWKYCHYAKKIKKRVIFAFVGVGDIKTNLEKFYWKKAIACADFISVRDEYSKIKLEKILKIERSIYVWYDPVFLLKNQHTDIQQKNIAINIYIGSNLPNEVQQNLIKTYAYLIDVLQNDYNVYIYTTESMDRVMAQNIYNRFLENTNVKYFEPKNLTELVEFYSNIDVVLATRMHAYIIATTQGIPSIIISWSDKIDGLIKQMDESESLYSINSVFQNKEILGQHIISLIKNVEKKRIRMKNKLRLIQKQFINYNNLLKEQLEL